MRKTSKIITALALAGIAVAGGSAFTAAGVATSAGTDGFVGGTVGQTIYGATLNSIDYVEPAGTAGNGLVSSIVLTFTTGADGRNVLATAAGGGANAGTFNCPDISSNGSTCTYVPKSGQTDAGYPTMTTLEVRVS